jgi:hypothetical protein
MAILDLIAQADETTEITSIENRLTDLEDFIQVDATSGYATFSASQSIASIVSDGTTTLSSIYDAAATTKTDTVDDGTYITTNTQAPTGFSSVATDTPSGTYEGKVMIDYTSAYLGASEKAVSDTRIEFTSTGEYSQIDTTTTSITNSVDDGTNTGTSLTMTRTYVSVSTTDGSSTNTTTKFSNRELTEVVSVSGIVSTLELDPDISFGGTQLYSSDGTSSSYLTLDPAGLANGTQLTTTDGTNIATLGSYAGEQISTITNGTWTNTLDLLPDYTQQTITDGNDSLTQIKQATSIQTTITEAGGANTTTQVIQPSGASLDILTTSGTFSQNITGVSCETSVYGQNGVSNNWQTDTLFLDPTLLANGSGFQSFDAILGQGQLYVKPNEIYLSVTDNLSTTSITIGTVSIVLDNIPSYDDDTAAGTGGLVPGMIYMTTGGGANPLDVAGILMIKQ